MNTPALEINHLTVTYQHNPVLWNVCASIPHGVLLAIVGPNGAGKTTIIKTILGLIKPLAGTISIFGKPSHTQRHAIAYVPQRATIDWDFPVTARDVVLMGCYGQLGWFRKPQAQHIQKAREALSLVDMIDFEHRPINSLSGGQQQRVFLARALMQEASIYIMDEPFVGVDMFSEKAIIQVLRQLRNQKKTIIAVHHDLNTVKEYFDWTLMINKSSISCGPIEQAFTPEHIQNTYKHHVFFAQSNQSL
ncbi:MAG: metal ABC transporter ATP-binding protein [Candidatus Dependentiae bacterium]